MPPPDVSGSHLCGSQRAFSYNLTASLAEIMASEQAAILSAFASAPGRLSSFPGTAAFCELTIEARKRAGLTQHEFAKRLKRPHSFSTKNGGGERRIDGAEFLAITRANGADPVRFCGHYSTAGLRLFPALVRR
jgi:hypothetical protein